MSWHLHRWTRWTATSHYVDTSWGSRTPSTLMARSCTLCGRVRTRVVPELLPLTLDVEPPPAAAGEVGSVVMLLSDDTFLRRECQAAPGAVGQVVRGHDGNRQDAGVLVDWGNGVAVRAGLDELYPLPRRALELADAVSTFEPMVPAGADPQLLPELWSAPQVAARERAAAARALLLVAGSCVGTVTVPQLHAAAAHILSSEEAECSPLRS